MLSIKDAIAFIGKTHEGVAYFINTNGNLNCTDSYGMTFYASETTGDWVSL